MKHILISLSNTVPLVLRFVGVIKYAFASVILKIFLLVQDMVEALLSQV